MPFSSPHFSIAVLEPTNKKLKIKIATIARWENGRIAEEHLFWDNASWNKQIGLDQCLGQQTSNYHCVKAIHL